MSNSPCGCKDRAGYRRVNNCSNCACSEEIAFKEVLICSIEGKTDLLVDSDEICDLWEER